MLLGLLLAAGAFAIPAPAAHAAGLADLPVVGGYLAAIEHFVVGLFAASTPTPAGRSTSPPHISDLSNAGQGNAPASLSTAQTAINQSAAHADPTSTPSVPPRTTSTPPAPAPAATVVTQAELDQALASLKRDLFGAIGSIGPAHEPDTIQHGVSITSAAGTFDAMTVNGLAALGSLTVSGDTALAGNLTVSGTFAGHALSLKNASTTLLSVAGPAYFGSTATSTFGTDGSLTLAKALGVASGGTGLPSVAAGSLLFGNGSSALATSSNLFWDNANGRLGVGTTTPGSLLSLGGIGNFAAATSTFYGTGGINLASGCFAVNGICAGGGGSGDVSNSGTPAAFQLAEWTDATHVKGVSQGVFNVRLMYGAVPDGSTDNSTAIANAFAASNGFTNGTPTVYFDCDTDTTTCQYNYGGSGISPINPLVPTTIECAPGVTLKYTGTGNRGKTPGGQACALRSLTRSGRNGTSAVAALSLAPR